MMIRRTLGLLAGFAALSAAIGTAHVNAAERSKLGRTLPASVQAMKLGTPLTSTGIGAERLHPRLVGATGNNRVIIRLANPAVAQRGLSGNATVQARDALRGEQAQFLNSVRALDPKARELARLQIVLNAVLVEVDAKVLPQLAMDPRVMRIAPVGNYQLDLTETVPYIGATAVRAKGVTGLGIKVAVLDSGIDYTHAALGGSGNPADFSANDPKVIEPGSFPTPKVVGGYDFTGSDWPNAAEAPDPDPLDAGPERGHGTHVADIIGGAGGVAPGASLYAVKVCSSVSTSCSGLALIQGMEFAADPNGDGKLDDRVDIINMSLGSSYGQPFDDDLATAVDNATKIGILTVASAGNSADKPYANGTPGGAATALSVAQTAVPSAFLPLMQIVAPANIVGNFPAVFQPWSAPLTNVVVAPVQYGNGANGNTDGCAPFAPGSLAGKIGLVLRGNCNFTLKIKNIADAGGVLGIIGLIAPGDAFEGGDGGDRPIAIPGYMVSQAVSNRLRSGLPNTVVRFDPAVGVALAGSMVGSSSRGPQHEDTHLIKPEIGAPGASVSAIAGSGTGTGPFGGTSGAAPMVAGAAALLLEGTGGTKSTAKGAAGGNAIGHGLTPLEVKARLMNNGFTGVINNPLTGELAPITRIGGGEVRVDRALAARSAAWDDENPQGALSFGFVDVADTVTMTRKVRVRNYGNKPITYTITPGFRFANDAANGAVSVSAPAKVTVLPGVGRDAVFEVKLTIDGSKLRGNFMNSGSAGADPATLTTNEYDGYVVLDDGQHPIHMAWHVLPRKAARVAASTTALVPGSSPQLIDLSNTGVGTAQNDAYALLATSPKLTVGGRGEQSPTPDIRAVGINTFPVPAGFCSANPSFLWAFAINTHARQQHLLPVSHQVYLDTNRDGTDDYVVLNRDASGLGTISDGRQLSWVLNLSTGAASAFFFAEHSTNTGNTVLLICGEQIGMSAANLLSTSVNMAVLAQDFYFGGPGDLVEGLTVTPLGERFYGVPVDLPSGASNAAGLAVYDFGAFPGNTAERGLMLVTNGDRGAGNRGGATADTEAILLLAP